MVWPTLGFRTAKEQNRTEQNRTNIATTGCECRRREPWVTAHGSSKATMLRSIHLLRSLGGDTPASPLQMHSISGSTVLCQWPRPNTLLYFAPLGLRSIVISLSVCASVCMPVHSRRITRKPCGRTSPIFCARCMCPWLGPPLTALRYVMYFRFYG